MELRAPGDTLRKTLTSDAWPLEQTHWTKFYLDAGAKTLGLVKPAQAPALYTGGARESYLLMPLVS